MFVHINCYALKEGIMTEKEADYDIDQAAAEMPRYKSHKTVWALKIAKIILDSELPVPIGATPDDSAMIFPEEQGYAPFRVDAKYLEKHEPVAGGYYVVYKDGYKSFSPASEFEDGNTLESELSDPAGTELTTSDTGYVIKSEDAINVLMKAFQNDPDYAHSWHCNIAGMCYDAMNNNEPNVLLPIIPEDQISRISNDAASRFMKLAFDVVTSNDMLDEDEPDAEVEEVLQDDQDEGKPSLLPGESVAEAVNRAELVEQKLKTKFGELPDRAIESDQEPARWMKKMAGEEDISTSEDEQGPDPLAHRGCLAR